MEARIVRERGHLAQALALLHQVAPLVRQDLGPNHLSMGHLLLELADLEEPESTIQPV